MLSVIMQSVVLLTVIYANYCILFYDESSHFDCIYAECHYAECTIVLWPVLKKYDNHK